MTPTTHLTVLTDKTLIYSNLVDQTLTKMLEFNVNNRIPLRTSWYLIGLQLVFSVKPTDLH